jgi:Raf kinase inhibitor-like YbhB/YbcL family protein
MAAFRLTSPAFEHDDPLPERFSSAGDDLSPPLAWSGVPEGTKELILVCDDPDADTGVFTHWVLYGILPDVSELPEGIPNDALVEDPVSLVQGINEFDEVGYTGPVLDEERGPHRLFFRLFALDVELLDLPPGVTRSELRTAAQGHILGTAELVGIA